ncbi:MAG: glycoside hydrolase family 5 protein [Phycisphaerae bacterium]
MRSTLKALLLCGSLFTLGCGTEAAPVGAPPPDRPVEPSPPSSFIRASGKQLVVGAALSPETIQLRGINVQNHWLLSPDDLSTPFFNDDEDRGVPIASLIPERFDETVVSNIASLGMNVIRNGINFRQFEDNADPYVYKPEGWALLDRQIALAKQAGLYTIIDLHVPPGGLQGFIGPTARLWEDPQLQDRTKALWRAIAQRYRDEPWVAAYDLINEPTPTQNPGQWATLAQELVETIRQVDTNHLIIIESITAVVDAQGNYPPIDPDDPWIPKLDDDNLMYDFHFYEPIDFVGQGRPENNIGDDGGRYPDDTYEYRDHDGTLLGVRNRAYLKRLIDEKLEFQRTYNVPINVGEFSPSRTTFFNNDAKGGLAYTADLIDVMNQAGLNHQYFAYLNVFFLDWEYDQTPELNQVTASLTAVLADAVR